MKNLILVLVLATCTTFSWGEIWTVKCNNLYPCGFSERGDFASNPPVYINGLHATKMSIKMEGVYTANFTYKVKDGDMFEYRVEDQWTTNFSYCIYDHYNEEIVRANPNSPFLGPPSEPLTVRTTTHQYPNPAYYSLPINGDTAYAINGSLEWNPPHSEITGYKLFWSKEGEPLKMVSDQQECSWALERVMDFNASYQWQVIPYNEYGEAQNCPIWKFKTSLFTFGAQCIDLRGVADFDEDGKYDFLDYSNYNLEREEYTDSYLVGYYSSRNNAFVPLFETTQQLYGSIIWYDFDNDNDLDIIVDYSDNYSDELCEFMAYINSNGHYSSAPEKITLTNDVGPSDIQKALETSKTELFDISGYSCELISQDIDADGDKDLVIESMRESDSINEANMVPRDISEEFVEYRIKVGNYVLPILINGESKYKFLKSTVPINQVQGFWGNGPTFVWCDFDLDGDSDAFVTCTTGNWGIGWGDIFINTEGILTPMNQGFGSGCGSFFLEHFWYDIDSDGDPDLLIKTDSEEGGVWNLFINNTIHNN